MLYKAKHLCSYIKLAKELLRCPGIEPGSTAWKAAMLTTIPTSLANKKEKIHIYI